jgi:TonB family protein
VGVLELESIPRIRIQLPRSREWTEISGQIAWVSESRKEAGIRFENLTEEVRNRISNWIASEVAASEPPRGYGAPPQKVTPLPEAPKVQETPPSIPEAASPAAATAEAANASLVAAAAEVTVAGPTVELVSLPAEQPPQDVGEQELASQCIPAQIQETPKQAGTPEISPQANERRQHARRRVKSLSYIELGETNGGIVINMSEEGLQVQAAVAITGDRVPRMRFQLPQSEAQIEVGGKIAWTAESKKEAGIQFIELPEDERAKLREWVASEPPTIGIHAVKATAREKSAPLPESPKVQEPGRAIRETGAFDRPVLRTQPQVAASSPLAFSAVPQSSAKVEAPAPVPVIRILKLAGDAEAEPRRKPALAWMNLGMQRRTWEIIAGVIAIASAISFSIGWIAARRSARDAAAAASGVREESAASEPAKNVPPAPASPIAPAPSYEGSKAHALGRQAAQGPAPATSAAKKETSGASSTKASPRPESDAAQPPRASAIQSPVAKVAAAPVASPPASTVKNNASPSPTSALAPPAPSNLAPPKPAPERPASAPVPVAAEKESAPSARKEPEIPAIPTGTVSVSYPPFPSIRVPAELKAQSSKLGTSLQMGQLITKVVPAYPEDMRRQRMEGTVKLHAVIGKDGVVQTVTLVNGPAMLAAPAINAILEWRYKPTLFSGQAIETEEDITVVFRLQSSPANSN